MFSTQRHGRLGDAFLRILITGGSGLLGSKISQKAIEEGHEVYSGYNTHEANFGIPVKPDIM